MRKGLELRLKQRYTKPKGLEKTNLILAYVVFRNHKDNIITKRHWIRDVNVLFIKNRYPYTRSGIVDYGVVKNGRHFSEKWKNQR